MSWSHSFDFVDNQNVTREILGLYPVKSNIVWKFFLSLLKQRSNIKQHREVRVAELKVLLAKLEELTRDEGKAQR